MTPEQKILLDTVPGAVRVRVRDASGSESYRKILELLDTDQIILTTAGQPTVTYKTHGRPKKLARITRGERKYSRKDPIVKKFANLSSDDASILLMKGLADDIAALGVERARLESNNVSTREVVKQRLSLIKTLDGMYNKYLSRQVDKAINLESIAFQKVFQHIMDTFVVAMKDSALRPEQIDVIRATFAKKIQDPVWAQEARAKMKN